MVQGPQREKTAGGRGGEMAQRDSAGHRAQEAGRGKNVSVCVCFPCFLEQGKLWRSI